METIRTTSDTSSEPTKEQVDSLFATIHQLVEENALFKKMLKIKSLDNVAADAIRIRSANDSQIVKKMFAKYKEEKRKNEDEEKIARKLNKFLDQALIRTSSRS